MSTRTKPLLSREQQKAARRQRLVVAAEALIRKTGDTDFSMLTLAQNAGLSPATPYNLFGSKSAILYAVLDKLADRTYSNLSRDKGADAFAHVLRATDALAEALEGDPLIYRPLYRYLLGVVDTVYRPPFLARSLSYWLDAVVGLAPVLPPGVRHEDLARQLLIQAFGATELWVHRELGDILLAAQLRQSACLLLLGFAPSKAARARLLAELGNPLQRSPVRR